MTTVSQEELRNNVGEVLRRAEGGERFTVTVSGRPVVGLGPAKKRQWVDGDALRRIWATPAPESLVEDLGRFPRRPR